MTKNSSILFTIFASLFCFTTFFEPYSFSWLIKILPFIFLFSACYQHLKQDIPKLKIFIVGLIFCVGGDIFLALDRGGLFVFGLGSFLIGHLFYIAAMLPIEKKSVSFIALIIVYGAAMFSLIQPGLDALFVPVAIYMFVLLTMTATTILTKSTNKWLIIGGVSFAVSDSLIGINKFYTPIPHSHVWIMITYYLAQYSLTRGFLTRQF